MLLLTPYLKDDLDWQSRFTSELRKMQLHTHDNLLKYYGAGEWLDGRLFIATEYCEKGSLDCVLADLDTQLPSSRIFDLAVQTCDVNGV